MFYNWHYHKQTEMIYIPEGTFDIHVDDELFSLAPGDVVLIGPNQLHLIRGHPGRSIVLQFDHLHYFDTGISPYVHIPLGKLNYILKENVAAKEVIARCIQGISDEHANKAIGYEIAVSALVRTILLTLLRNDSRKLLPVNNLSDIIRFQPVLDYIDRHITGKISVEETCRLANMSYYYFVKQFKKVIGMSFIDYVNCQKIKMAERVLLTQDISINEVGEAIGMPSMPHFYKHFKKINHCSPKQYREKMLAWEKSQQQLRKEDDEYEPPASMT